MIDDFSVFILYMRCLRNWNSCGGTLWGHFQYFWGWITVLSCNFSRQGDAVSCKRYKWSRPFVVFADSASLCLQVCLRSSPLYNAGALAFNVGNETPRVGEVVTSLWNFAVNKLRFKVISPNGEKEKASPASAAGQPDVSPVVGSSKIS